MATTTKLDDYLALLGFDPETTYDVPENPADAALSGVAAFVREHSAGQETELTGIIHITGPSALGNSAPVKAVGNLLTSIQSTIDAVGASLMGNRSAGGSLPSAITSRTEMSLIASPMPGSIVIQVAPSLARMDDLYPEGLGLFDAEAELDAKPLADQAFIEFSTLISELREDGPDNSQFVDHLTDLGPRVATAMKSFCESIDKGVLDLELEWTESSRKAKTASISHSHAERAARLIASANIENEEVTIEGVLLTVTQSTKDNLRILEDDGQEVVVTIGDIPPAATYPLHTGERVRIRAEKRVSRKLGGTRSEKLVGKAVELATKLEA